jgi:hypothetical protein
MESRIYYISQASISEQPSEENWTRDLIALTPVEGNFRSRPGQGPAPKLCQQLSAALSGAGCLPGTVGDGGKVRAVVAGKRSWADMFTLQPPGRAGQSCNLEFCPLIERMNKCKGHDRRGRVFCTRFSVPLKAKP